MVTEFQEDYLLNYSLEFSLGANAAGAVGRVASVRCLVVGAGGSVLVDKSFAVPSLGTVSGGFGCDQRCRTWAGRISVGGTRGFDRAR